MSKTLLKQCYEMLRDAPIEHSTHLEHGSTFCDDMCQGCEWEFQRDEFLDLHEEDIK